MRRWTDLTKMYDDDPIRGYEQFSIYPEWLLPGQEGGTIQIGGNIELIDAAQNNNIDLVRQLLDNGIDINVRDDTGNTALARASQEEGHDDIVELLLEKDANPNIQDHDGNTALMWASYNVNIEIIELLLNSGANTNIPDHDGVTVLMWATDEGYTEIVELFLRAGADPTIQDKYGYTSLDMAYNNGLTDIVELFKRHINATKIQSRARGKLTRSKARIQKAKQRSSFMKGAYDDESIIRQNMRFDENIYGDISKYISQMPYNPGVSIRMREENR